MMDNKPQMGGDRDPEFMDEKAFSALYEEHFQTVYRFGYRLLGDTEQAKDLAQEVFKKLYLSLNGGAPPAAVKAWLYKSAANLSYDWVRRKNRFRKVCEKGPIFSARQQDVGQEFEREEETRAVRRALEKLPPKEQILIMLYQDGLSYREIAQAAGVRRSSVGVLISRAVKKLARGLREGEMP